MFPRNRKYRIIIHKNLSPGRCISNFSYAPFYCGIPVPDNETIDYLVCTLLLVYCTTMNTLRNVPYITIRDMRMHTSDIVIPDAMQE